jgi:oligoendopeptidase F
VHKHLPALHRYLTLKQKALQVPELHAYDLYIPISQATDTYKFTFTEACDFISKALAPLGATYGQVLQHAFTHRWIDRYENRGKRSGAYSWGIYGLHPYVLMSYQPGYRSMSTIAHELGHSLHSYFTNQTQPYATSDYTIFCAEIASTTNEILLSEYALAQADPDQKLFLLNQILENIRTTVYRQLQFAEFEKYIHTKIGQGESLQAQDLDTYWLKNNATYYGPALTTDQDLAAEWSRIPHFYTPIYVYKYATGYAAATAFARSILEQQPGAVEKYLTFLHSGASDYPLNLLQQAGVDFNTTRPLEITLENFAAKLQELTKLLER